MDSILNTAVIPVTSKRLDQTPEVDIKGGPFGSWIPGERELYYNLPTNDPVTGYVDSCSMFVDLSYRRLRRLNLERFVKANDYLIITHLYLQHNKLTELPDNVFLDLKNLVHLDARNNDLTSFPVSVRGHEGLKTILVQDNLIKTFPIELGSLEALKTLGIEYNPLEFPSHALLNHWRNKGEIIDFFKRCWEAKSIDVPAVVMKIKNKTFKPKKPKIVKVKEPSEIVYELKRSSNFKEQKAGEKIKNHLQTQQKLLQQAKDNEVLKGWQDQYRKYKSIDRLVVLQPPPFGINERYNRITSKLEAMQIDSEKKKLLKYRLNIDEEIIRMKETLASLANESRFRDPEREMASRLREIKTIRKLQAKIEHLKYRC